MHFDFTITLGNVVTLGVFLGGIIRFEWAFRRYGMEHEILVRDYCERHSIKISDLPTRFKGGIV